MLNIKPIKCNGGCPNCYEAEVRKWNVQEPDIEAMLKALAGSIPKMETNPTLHGGEPLMLGKRTVKSFFKIIYEKFKQTGIQTNGLLIDDEWLDIFSEFNTHVGVSLDGHLAAMNRGRFGNEPEQTVQPKIDTIIDSMTKARCRGLAVSVIAVMRRWNCGPNRIEDFCTFLKMLSVDLGIPYIRTNAGIVFKNYNDKEELTPDELGTAYKIITDVCISDKRYLWQPIRDIIEMLSGHNRSTCVFGECDPWMTEAEIPILPEGSFGNCLKTPAALDGVLAVRSSTRSRARYEVLERIPFDKGGCGGCEWWVICKGGCPGEALNDWRDKTRFCQANITMIEHIAKKITGLLPNYKIREDVGVLASTWRKDVQSKDNGQHGHGDSNDPQWVKDNPRWKEGIWKPS